MTWRAHDTVFLKISPLDRRSVSWALPCGRIVDRGGTDIDKTNNNRSTSINIVADEDHVAVVRILLAERRASMQRTRGRTTQSRLRAKMGTKRLYRSKCHEHLFFRATRNRAKQGLAQ